MSAPRTVGGRFDFDDGGTYCGGWEDGKAHGHGVCTGPKGQGEYSGSWHFGFEVSGVYSWPSGSCYEGQWQNGKRHGLGAETRGRWLYRGEWTQGFKGRYGVRQSLTSGAKYEGTWANGLQDGYGSEVYADGGVYQGQWMRGMRHGYGVRSSAPFGLASHYRPKNIRASLTSLRSEHVDPASERDRKIDDCRGGFVLKSRSDEPPPRRRSLAEKSTNLKRSILQGLRIKKQRSTGDIGSGGSIRSTGSAVSSASSESSQSGLTRNSAHTDSNVSFVSQDDVTDANVVETYMGEWKNDKRSGYGIAERADGLKYEGEWYGNKKYGYGVTSFKDGTREEGKYKNNVLVTSGKKKHLFLLRSAKFRERVQSAVNAAVRASQIALQKADIAISRTATARGKAEQADVGAMHAREDSDVARLVAKQFAPEFNQPGTDELLNRKLADQTREPPAPAGAPPMARRPAEETRSMYGPREGGPYERFRGGAHEKAPESPGPPTTNYLDPSSASGGSLRPQRHYTLQQAMNDHFDQYRATRGPTPPQREAPVVLPAAPPGLLRYGPDCTPDSGVSESMDPEDASPTRPSRRSTLPNLLYGDNCGPPPQTTDSLLSFAPASDSEETTSDDTSGPQRSASLHHVPPARGGANKAPSTANPPKRKKSLPDIAAAAAKVMSREEVAALSSMRREQLRRQQEEAERLRANPLLYLLNPDVKDWFSRQQLVMLVLVINISLAIMFFKLLT